MSRDWRLFLVGLVVGLPWLLLYLVWMRYNDRGVK